VSISPHPKPPLVPYGFQPSQPFTHTFPRFGHRIFNTHPSSSAVTASEHIQLVRQD
jgi:hypothetical protein